MLKSKAPSNCNLLDISKSKAYIITRKDPLPMKSQKTDAAMNEFHYRLLSGRFGTKVLWNWLCKS